MKRNVAVLKPKAKVKVSPPARIFPAESPLTLGAALRESPASIEETLWGQLLRYYPKDRVTGEPDMWVEAKGDIPLCLVAHWDTWAKYPVELNVKGNIVAHKGGGVLGADDRAGIWGVLEVVRRVHGKGGKLPHVLFTNYEESGGRGVLDWTALQGDWVEGDPVLYVELDRANVNDFVDYSGALPKRVERYLESFGFRHAHGTYSDVAEIADWLEVPAVNVSVGYYGQHTAKEELHIDELALTVNRVIEMCRRPLKKLHRLSYTRYSKFGDYGQGWDYWEDDYGKRGGWAKWDGKP